MNKVLSIQKIKLGNYKILQDFEIDFRNSNSEILDTIVIAGVNGSGKSTLLDFIEEKLLEMHQREQNYKEYIYEQNELSISNEADYVPFELISDMNKFYIYLRVNELPTHLIVDQIKDFIDMIKDQNEDITVKEANQKAVDSINSIFDGLDLKTKFQGISKDIERNILFKNDINENIKLNELSTGEQQLFIRALSLKMTDINNGIILIDEPETSLHPNWQNHILKVYQNIASQGNNQLIIATHSPQIISSTPNESLRLLVKDGKDIKVKTYDNSYGREIEEVLQDIMGTEYLRTPKIAKKIKQMWDAIHSKNIELFDELYNELENILDLNDKDLVLARLEKSRVISNK